MNNVVSHIEYLLQRHDCVIVPGLGAILAHATVAFYDEKLGQWCPPNRVLSFNPELSRNDGLLVSSLARRESISVDAAALKVRSSVEMMRCELEEIGALSLGKVGRLLQKENGRMIFETVNTAWLSPECIWLPQLDIRPIARTTADINKALGRQILQKSKSESLRWIGRVAASIAVILALAWVVKTILPLAPVEQYASVAPTVAVVDEVEEIETPLGSTLVLIVNRHEDAFVEVEEKQPVVVPELSLHLDESDKYFLIVASLGSRAEAEKYINRHSDVKLGLLTVDGRNRVYVASDNDLSHLYTIAKSQAVTSRYPSSWVCHK